MRNFAAFALSTVLVGCTQTGNLLEPPDVKDIFVYSQEVEKLSGARIVTGADLVAAAYVVVDDRCQVFFDTLERHKADLLFARNTTLDATSLAVQVLTQLTVAQRDIGIVSASGKFVSDAMQSYNTIYNLAPFSNQLYRLVGEAQADYKNKMLDRLADLERGPITNASVLYDASNVAQSYGKICSYSQFQTFVETALNHANAVNEPPGQNIPKTADTLVENNSQRRAYLPPYVAQ